jgi:opacity protein-like surface antigen
MKQFFIALAIFASFLFGNAFASEYQGLNIVVSANQSDSKFDLGNNNSIQKINLISEKDSNLSLEVEYIISVGLDFTVGFGGYFGFGDIKAGNNSNASLSYLTSGVIKDQVAVFFAPGFTINPNTNAYFKMSAIRATIQLSNSGYSENFGTSGLGVGLGLKYAVTPNAYLQVEVSENNFNLNSTVSRTTSLGVGYRF